MKQKLLAGVLILGGLIAASGCASTNEDGEVALKSIEEMSELEFSRTSQYIYLGTKIGVARLIDGGGLTAETADAVADVLEGLIGEAVLEFSGGFITDLVAAQVELTGDELMLILLIVEQELLSRGGATFIDDLTGEVRLTERTESILLLVADALRSAAGGVTPAEEGQHAALEKTRQ